MNKLVGYHILGVTPELVGVGTAYNYIVAGDGVYIRAESHHLAVCIPIADAEVRGLPPCTPHFVMKHGLIPQRFFDLAFSVFLAHPEHERFVAITWRDGAYQIVVPDQVCEAASVHYVPVPDTVLELHSHGLMTPFFSSTDDKDEQGLRLYGVVGSLGKIPGVQFRVGVYGYFQEVGYGDVFDGALSGILEVHDEEGIGGEPSDNLFD